MSRLYVVFSLVIILSGCAKQHFIASEVKNNSSVQSSKATQVIVKGDIPVELVQNNSDPIISFRGKDSELDKIEITRQDSIIQVIDKLPNKRSSVVVVVNTMNANKFAYSGDATIRANVKCPIEMQLQTDKLITIVGKINVSKLTMKGSGKIRFNRIESDDLSIDTTDAVSAILEGKVKLTELAMSDCAWIKVYWNDSSYLKFRGKDKVFADIAGKVNTLDVNINEGAHFNGRFLRAKVAYVKAADVARADINAEDISHLVATGKSNIYTHNNTEVKHLSSSDSAVVMKKLDL